MGAFMSVLGFLIVGIAFLLGLDNWP